jgi:hypothetical protein
MPMKAEENTDKLATFTETSIALNLVYQLVKQTEIFYNPSWSVVPYY